MSAHFLYPPIITVIIRTTNYIILSKTTTELKKTITICISIMIKKTLLFAFASCQLMNHGVDSFLLSSPSSSSTTLKKTLDSPRRLDFSSLLLNSRDNDDHDGYVIPTTNKNDDRRSFLKSLAFSPALVMIASSTSAAANAKDSVNYKDVTSDITELIKNDPNKGPTLVRLAWHSSGTYDKMSKTGGSGLGTIRFKEELAHGGNAGLESTAVAWLEPIKEKYGDSISYADLYTLAGVAAIKALGGPSIPWKAGRVDALDPSAVTPDGRLPNADSGPPGADPSDASHVRTIFNRMGFNDQEIVALSGAHALGRCHTTASGYDGPWTPTPTAFNNLYFVLLNTVDWTKREWSGPFQYEDGNKKLMMLPTDLVLVQDKKFKKYVDVYAKDESKFFKDFSAAFSKLEELGTKNLVKVDWEV